MRLDDAVKLQFDIQIIILNGVKIIESFTYFTFEYIFQDYVVFEKKTLFHLILL